ncbi:hypothetical protein AAC387_Pa03g1155 [Persea americana]
MEGAENGYLDDTEQSSEREKEQYAMLITLSGAVASWRQQMYLLASYYALTKKKAKRINRDLARDQYIQTLTSGREVECLSQLRMKTHTFHLLCHTLREKGLLRDTRESKDKEVAMSKDKEVSKSKGKQVKKYITFDVFMDKEMLDLMFDNVATGQYARPATAAPSHQLSDGYTAGYSPFQVDSNVGITSQFNGCQIQSSGGETSSKRENP